jgi:ABC-type sugar transport system, periplasmic component
MNRLSWTNAAGLGLLAVCFLLALGRVLLRVERESSDTVVIRIAHWQLESGLRDAFDAAAKDYMERNPGVIVEQLPVPERVFKSWLRTQLVGGTAPDIIEMMKGLEPTTISRYFFPLSEALDAPNPHNAGTPLENEPWRRTFSDGLISSFNEVLLDYYSVPTSMFTVRAFYNKTLWREIFGNRPPPSTYEEFMEVCEGVVQFSARTGRKIIPVSSSRYHAKYLTDRMFQSQTQRLMFELDRSRGLAPTGMELGIDYLTRKWNYDNPAMRDGFQIVHEVGRYMQPGFSQLAREDGTFYFVQGHALMTSSGSWDASSLRAQAPFELGAFPIPLPSKEHPRFGKNVIGVASEAGTESGAQFGVTRASKHPEIALDFLRYLTSRDANERFMKRSGWLPIIEGVEPSDEDVHVKPFMPVLEGELPGIAHTMANFGNDFSQMLQDQFHLLVGPDGSVDRYLAAVLPRMDSAVRSDLSRRANRARWNLWRQDATAAAYWQLHRLRDDPVARKRWSLTLEAQTQQEANALWIERALATPSAPASETTEP